MATLYEPDVDDMNGFQGVFSSQNYRDVIVGGAIASSVAAESLAEHEI
jgi:hypothetical protein